MACSPMVRIKRWPRMPSHTFMRRDNNQSFPHHGKVYDLRTKSTWPA